MNKPLHPILKKLLTGLAVAFIYFLIAAAFFLIVTNSASTALETWQRSRMNPLQLAAYDGDLPLCTRLIKSGLPVDSTDADGDTALDWAVYRCNLPLAQSLIDLGADSNHTDTRGFTPLHYTATPLRGKILTTAPDERTQLARLLIQHGADVNRSTPDAQTPLHFAAADKNPALVQTLLAAGANPNVKSQQGYTPLDVARFPTYAPNTQVITLLQHPPTDHPAIR